MGRWPAGKTMDQGLQVQKPQRAGQVGEESRQVGPQLTSEVDGPLLPSRNAGPAMSISQSTTVHFKWVPLVACQLHLSRFNC